MKRVFRIFTTLCCCLITLTTYANTNKLTLWGPPATPTVLLEVAATHGKAKDIIPFEVKTWKHVDELRTGLAKNTIQASIIPSNLAAILYNKGRDIKLTTIVTQGLLSIVTKSHEIKTLSDLQNRKVIIPFKGDIPDQVLTILLKDKNVTLNKTYVTTPVEAVNLFLSKDFDTALLMEPAATMAIMKAKQQGIELNRALSLRDEWNKEFKSNNGFTQAGLFVTGDFCQLNPKFMQQLQQDLVDAVAWVNANPEAAADLLGKHLPMPKPILAKSFEFSNLSALDMKKHHADALKFYQELFNVNPRAIGGKLPDANLFICQ